MLRMLVSLVNVTHHILLKNIYLIKENRPSSGEGPVNAGCVDSWQIVDL